MNSNQNTIKAHLWVASSHKYILLMGLSVWRRSRHGRTVCVSRFSVIGSAGWTLASLHLFSEVTAAHGDVMTSRRRLYLEAIRAADDDLEHLRLPVHREDKMWEGKTVSEGVGGRARNRDRPHWHIGVHHLKTAGVYTLSHRLRSMGLIWRDFISFHPSFYIPHC